MLRESSRCRARSDGTCQSPKAVRASSRHARYLRYHIEIMVGERGPIAIMSEIPSLKAEHREEVLELSRRHSKNFEAILESGLKDGSIAECDVRMTGNAIMGSINWIPKWFHGDITMASSIIAQFPTVLTRGLAPG